MALVYRNGRAYLYRSVRRGGRVTSEYVGSGLDALMIDRLNGVDRDEEDYRRWCERKERREVDELERELDELNRRAKALAEEALIAAGYHRHHRGEWRKQRVKGNRPEQAG